VPNRHSRRDLAILVYNSFRFDKNGCVLPRAGFAQKALYSSRLCERILAQPLAKAFQADGRIRFWGIVPELGGRVLRVVTLADAETIHNAFPDRNFKMPVP